mgnify:CR=1 FL=1
MALPRCFELIFGTLRYSAMRCFALPILEPKTTRTTLREGLALALSSCGDGYHSAGDAVGLLGLGAMGAKTDNLAAVGSLA